MHGIPEPKEAAVCIVFDSPPEDFVNTARFEIYFEGRLLCEAADLMQAVELYLSVMHIFNVQ